MLYGLSLRMIGGIVGAVVVAAFIALAFHWRSAMTERGQQLATICAATRAASGVTKLDCKQVPQQIAFMGEAITAMRTKTAQAQAADAANKTRVEGEQANINQERDSAYQTRLTAARALADRLRAQLEAAAHSGNSGKPSVPGIPSTASVVAETAEQDRFSLADRYTATAQAIQLDELIKWVQAQHAVDVNGQQPVPQR